MTIANKSKLKYARDRTERKSHATTATSHFTLAFGNGAPIRRRDLVLIRQAIRNDYPIPDETRAALVQVIQDLLDDEQASSRLRLSAAKTLIMMDEHNRRVEAS